MMVGSIYIFIPMIDQKKLEIGLSEIGTGSFQDGITIVHAQWLIGKVVHSLEVKRKMLL